MLRRIAMLSVLGLWVVGGTVIWGTGAAWGKRGLSPQRAHKARRSTKAQRAERHLTQARQHMRFGRFDKALAACRRAFGEHSDIKYILWLARIHARANQMKRARAAVALYRQLRREQRLARARAQRPSRSQSSATARARPASRRAKQPRKAAARPRLSDIVPPSQLERVRRQLGLPTS